MDPADPRRPEKYLELTGHYVSMDAVDDKKNLLRIVVTNFFIYYYKDSTDAAQ